MGRTYTRIAGLAQHVLRKSPAPGVLVVEHHRGTGVNRVSGLRDPAAPSDDDQRRAGTERGQRHGRTEGGVRAGHRQPSAGRRGTVPLVLFEPL